MDNEKDKQNILEYLRTVLDVQPVKWQKYLDKKTITIDILDKSNSKLVLPYAESKDRIFYQVHFNMDVQSLLKSFKISNTNTKTMLKHPGKYKYRIERAAIVHSIEGVDTNIIEIVISANIDSDSDSDSDNIKTSDDDDGDGECT